MLRCGATWPLKDVSDRNYTALCPSLWHLESKKTGICAAPAIYDGPCQTRFNFTTHDADMKKAFEGRCKVGVIRAYKVLVASFHLLLKAFFPISAFATLPKLQPLLSDVALAHDATGPIGPAATKYYGTVVPPDGTIYLPSKAGSSGPSIPHEVGTP